MLVAEMHPFFAAAYRFIIAAGLMLLIVLVRRERIPLKYLRIYVILGLVGICGFNLLFFISWHVKPRPLGRGCKRERQGRSI
jgi:drug/metabolite transporter (DMT)-like permease